ncbi:MAG: formylglycine-generating enzyme family protein, partial [Muribaculaceae bacterium]
MEFKTLSYKSLRNTGLGMVFKCVMMVILLSVVSSSVAAQEMTVEGTEKIASEGQPDPKIETFEVNGVTFEMVYVPGGTYTMGATAEQGDEAWDDEKPTHSVTLSGYYIGK